MKFLGVPLWFFITTGLGFAGPISVTDFGAKGDGVTDDTAAVSEALAASREIHFPAGVYVLTDGIDLPDSAILTGVGSPMLGTFPLRDDDKRFLSAEGIADLPGATLLFRGKGTRSIRTGRKDEFSEVRYAIRTATGLPYRIENLAVCLDVRIRNADNQPTNPDDDGRADYDVGVLVDDSPGGSLHDVSVFGYWKKAGLCVVSRGKGSNPDYNTFWNCSFSGEYGAALIGSDSDPGPGLSGTQFYGCNLFSNDHHSRRSGQWGSGALFIDGHTDGKHADINGQYFFGGCVRTYSNVAVRLNRASNLSFHSVVFEVPSWDGDHAEGADTTGKIIGTAETRDVMFFGCRMRDIGLGALAKGMTDGAVTVVGGLRQGISIQSGNSAVKLQASPEGDPLLQISRDLDSINHGWTVRLDVSDEENLVLRHDNRPALTLTPDGSLVTQRLKTRALSVGRSFTSGVIANQAKVAGARTALKAKDESQLTVLDGGTEGEIVILEIHRDSAPITVTRAEGGNLSIPAKMFLDHPDDRLVLLRSNDRWVELSCTEGNL